MQLNFIWILSLLIVIWKGEKAHATYFIFSKIEKFPLLRRLSQISAVFL